MLKITFVHEHETARKSRYSELMPGDIMRVIYLPSDTLRQQFGKVPKTITLTIEETE